jgi:acyl carrier protein
VDTREEIRRYLLEHSVTPGVTTLDDGWSLMEQGVLDSFGLVELLGFLEERFGLQVADEEMEAAHFATVQSICEFVARKQTEDAAGRPARGATG